MPDSRVLCRMRPIVVVLGVILLLAGAVWALQGAGYLLGAFMSNDPTRVWIGIVTALAGVRILGFRGRNRRGPKELRQTPHATRRLGWPDTPAPLPHGGAGRGGR